MFMDVASALPLPLLFDWSWMLSSSSIMFVIVVFVVIVVFAVAFRLGVVFSRFAAIVQLVGRFVVEVKTCVRGL